ncbi:DNA-binding response OmpR family regulator [Parabacteroides sp. PF5-5]|uniref:response regulator transcription factor n=1 Tax=unclassified Parabacteroides TaxID=2649774 RepID=UPI002473C265|nr:MULTISPECIES: response regulator transcription factor [unclassified Parabacteroides]MDH6304883.1 DNA-binding response OmpR family regulator [Parabacteroides sp. PH5-39]MDH6316031.1 DNA-binding response OmpR family regulator [Parabacteroides sp. PF5-13]MDH6319688.1 DNA-binding response OmpR family regulator [Parabacteroides sp. PH5-13]MDH6323419.1 DNA-binding response OmpR family regulator [Parabacteroides sp. PH5-8]MDH6327072.1 DNA-binding response OmpR family regulator [Parabacteroides sp.
MKDDFRMFLFEKDEVLGLMLQEFMLMENIHSDVFTQHETAYDVFCEKQYPICLIALEKSPEKEFELARKIREMNKETILIFTSLHPTLDVVTQAYETGAYDLIRKPFVLEELYLRIVAILRRTHGFKGRHDQVYRIGQYVLDTHTRDLLIGDKHTKVTTKECDLLKYLCEHVNEVVEREAVLKNVWRCDSFHNARSMDVYITKLRKLLEGDNAISIVNIHGRGYKLLVC